MSAPTTGALLEALYDYKAAGSVCGIDLFPFLGDNPIIVSFGKGERFSFVAAPTADWSGIVTPPLLFIIGGEFTAMH
jgi:hypothetical protein